MTLNSLGMRRSVRSETTARLRKELAVVEEQIAHCDGDKNPLLLKRGVILVELTRRGEGGVRKVGEAAKERRQRHKSGGRPTTF